MTARMLATLSGPAGLVEAFRLRREALGIGEALLAAKTGLPPRDIALFEAQLDAVDSEVFCAIAAALGVFVSVNEAHAPADYRREPLGKRYPSVFGDLA